MSQAMSHPQAIERIAGTIKDIRIAMLSTVHSRWMATQEVEFQGELLFLTWQESSKNDEIVHQSRVTLNYVDSKNHSFVTLSAAPSQDRATIHEL